LYFGFYASASCKESIARRGAFHTAESGRMKFCAHVNPTAQALKIPFRCFCIAIAPGKALIRPALFEAMPRRLYVAFPFDFKKENYFSLFA